MKRIVRISAGSLLILFGLVTFFILPGSILLILLGLVILSYDVPVAKGYIKTCQRIMRESAVRIDRFLLNRKYKRF
ncbi:tellurium resistance protein TerC [Neptunicella marina]|uniref:Tellurium resistance protein TerC n=1 Tax=Neptunicella marina TaxID=2125989 RepID=A0A8J6IMP9_9ALTE|nr:tellurium resistance protein TerC [Neptunicella marina]MBC3764296.1 tellurium resistance protein TerC [Neptunicella marina]